MTKPTYSLQVRPNELVYFIHLYIFISTKLGRTVRLKNKNKFDQVAVSLQLHG